MQLESEILFPPFRLDIANERLWRGSQEITLRPKTFAVLRCLVEHPGRLVSKEELLRAVWPDTRVSEAGQRDYIRELRKALGDDSGAPQFIETVHGRGYRWIAETRDWRLETSPPSPQVSSLKPLASSVVGRESELAQLHSWLNKALSGERQIVFVTGEPGIGKTTLVEAFLEQVTAAGDVRVARGQCIEHYGAGEAYLPVLEALGRLCRGPGGEQVIPLLGRYAPTWLAQMPWLVSDADHEVLRRKIGETSQKYMLREMAEAVEALTAERGFVLALEDLHWSDYSTLDLLAFLAQRRERARLLLVGTYRPMDVLMKGHPLHTVKQELQIHKSCEELPLESLTESDIAEYLTL